MVDNNQKPDELLNAYNDIVMMAMGYFGDTENKLKTTMADVKHDHGIYIRVCTAKQAAHNAEVSYSWDKRSFAKVVVDFTRQKDVEITNPDSTVTGAYKVESKIEFNGHSVSTADGINELHLLFKHAAEFISELDRKYGGKMIPHIVVDENDAARNLKARQEAEAAELVKRHGKHMRAGENHSRYTWLAAESWTNSYPHFADGTEAFYTHPHIRGRKYRVKRTGSQVLITRLG